MSLSIEQNTSEETIAEIVERLVNLASPVKIILFGSNATGTATPNSDLDILIVEKEVTNQHDETLRLDRALRDLMLPVDLVVVSEARLDKYGKVPGTVYYRSLKEGRVLYAQ